MSFINILKKIPFDFGQGNLRKKTKGKLIAMEFIEIGKGKKALDIGCRDGDQSKILESRGYKVTSIDIKKTYSKCKIVDVNKKLPFKKNYFDLIWCSEVIEHLDNPKKSLNDFRRILKKNGKMILTTPNSYFWLVDLLNFFGISPKRLQNPGHKYFFNYGDIKRIFPKAHIYGFFPYLFLKFKIKRFVGFLSPTFVIIEKS